MRTNRCPAASTWRACGNTLRSCPPRRRWTSQPPVSYDPTDKATDDKLRHASAGRYKPGHCEAKFLAHVPPLGPSWLRRLSVQSQRETFPSNNFCRPGPIRWAHAQSSALNVEPDKPGFPEKLKTLLPPSEEQQLAIDTLLHTKNNLIIDACAGSGKTTTILHLAASAADTKFLVLVYNRRLMVETEERVQDLGLRNATVLNYHTLGVRYYTPECATDQGLKRVFEDDMPVMDGMELPDFSVLVLDEQQDMTPILKLFVDKVIRDKGYAGKSKQPTKAKHPLRMVVLGDKRQELYGFNNADSRFLTMAARPEVFGYINSEAWTSADLTTSRRLTQQNVDFINEQMLKMPPALAMRAVKKENEQGISYPKPRYVICDPHEDVVDEVLRLLDNGDFSPADIIVLAPSVRGSSAALYLANELALQGIPVFRADSDNSDVTPQVARGKVLICTYHQAKGIERRAAIVLGFDQDYHTWFAKVRVPPIATSNPQYVAATRAVEHLVLIHNYKQAALPFVNLDSIEESCDLVMVRALDVEESNPGSRLPRFSVTALCRNLSETLITACLRHLQVRSLAEPAYGVQPSPPTEIEDKYGLVEGVSNITGTAITAIFQWASQQRLSALSFRSPLLRLLEPPKRKTRRPNPLRKLPEQFYEKIRMAKNAQDEGTLTTDDILFLSTMKMASIDGDIVKLLAIPLDKYSWLSEEYCRSINDTLKYLPAAASLRGRGIRFETQIHRRYDDIDIQSSPTNLEKKQGILVGGEMDMCRSLYDKPKTVWEVKYTTSLQPEHVLQVALYMLLLQAPASGFLVSVRTGQTVEVIPRTPKSLKEVLRLLVDAKSGGERSGRLLNTYSDEEFLKECGRDFTGLVDKCALPPWFAKKPSGSKKYRRRATVPPTTSRRKTATKHVV